MPVTLLSQIVKSASLKACQRQDGMSYYLSRTPATIGKRYPLRKGFKPCYSATRPGASTQPPQSDTPEKVSPASSTCTKGAKGEARTHSGEDGTRTRNLPQAKRAHHQIVLHPQKTHDHQSTNSARPWAIRPG